MELVEVSYKELGLGQDIDVGLFILPVDLDDFAEVVLMVSLQCFEVNAQDNSNL